MPSRIRGTVRLRPDALAPRTFELDAAGRHRWRPIAPCARVEVELDRPGLSWSGPAYLDTNDGDRPLEDDFVLWDWCRAKLSGGDTAISYNVARRDGTDHSVAIRCEPSGEVRDFDPPPPASLPPTRLWRVPRGTRADAGHAPRHVQTLEDAPFYSRSVISTRLLGEEATAVHESLSLDRFRAGWVQAMLPFKVPRALR